MRLGCAELLVPVTSPRVAEEERPTPAPGQFVSRRRRHAAGVSFLGRGAWTGQKRSPKGHPDLLLSVVVHNRGPRSWTFLSGDRPEVWRAVRYKGRGVGTRRHREPSRSSTLPRVKEGSGRIVAGGRPRVSTGINPT